jgi:hypothetical protein
MNTYEEAVLKVAMWWSDKSFRTPLNQDNGGKDSPQEKMTNMLLGAVSLQAQKKITDEKIKKFEKHLYDALMLMKDKGARARTLDVDYDPCDILFEVAKASGIDTGCLPVKSSTYIDEQNRAWAKYQYGGQTVEI